jgi:hypothetical protein
MSIDVSKPPMGSEKQEPAISWSTEVVEFKDSYLTDSLFRVDGMISRGR